MFYKRSYLISFKIKEFFKFLPGGLLVSSLLIGMLLGMVNDQFGRWFFGIFFVATAIFFLGREVYYAIRFAKERKNARAAQLAHADKVLAAAKAARLAANTVATAPVVVAKQKTLLFNYEEHL